MKPCKGREGSSCDKNNNCNYPECKEMKSKTLQKLIDETPQEINEYVDKISEEMVIKNRIKIFQYEWLDGYSGEDKKKAISDFKQIINFYESLLEQEQKEYFEHGFHAGFGNGKISPNLSKEGFEELIKQEYKNYRV